jgi:hypothetical protein
VTSDSAKAVETSLALLAVPFVFSQDGLLDAEGFVEAESVKVTEAGGSYAAAVAGSCS